MNWFIIISFLLLQATQYLVVYRSIAFHDLNVRVKLKRLKQKTNKDYQQLAYAIHSMMVEHKKQTIIPEISLTSLTDEPEKNSL
jgi:hypothetical protein